MVRVAPTAKTYLSANLADFKDRKLKWSLNQSELNLYRPGDIVSLGKKECVVVKCLSAQELQRYASQRATAYGSSRYQSSANKLSESRKEQQVDGGERGYVLASTDKRRVAVPESKVRRFVGQPKSASRFGLSLVPIGNYDTHGVSLWENIADDFLGRYGTIEAIVDSDCGHKVFMHDQGLS